MKAELTPESDALRKVIDSQNKSKRAMFQHSQKNIERFWDDPLAHGVATMGNCQLKRIVLGRENPPKRKKYVPKAYKLPALKVT